MKFGGDWIRSLAPWLIFTIIHSSVWTENEGGRETLRKMTVNRNSKNLRFLRLCGKMSHPFFNKPVVTNPLLSSVNLMIYSELPLHSPLVKTSRSRPLLVCWLNKHHVDITYWHQLGSCPRRSLCVVIRSNAWSFTSCRPPKHVIFL